MEFEYQKFIRIRNTKNENILVNIDSITIIEPCCVNKDVTLIYVNGIEKPVFAMGDFEKVRSNIPERFFVYHDK